jgi:glutamate---cysteine ligase / carboxylate-amine ligase
MTQQPLGLFAAYGVELEYMIVDAHSAAVRPITDVVLQNVAGSVVSDIELGDISWSNELALHVIELKTTDPATELGPLAERFQQHVERVNDVLRPLGARLMPGAMHPTMNPEREMQLWPHDYNAVYEAFNRIFDCRGHGWANLQSVHLNLPFADDDQFGRLHAAIRLLLPLLPALAASSPIMDGRRSGLLDTRLDVYRGNAARIPSISGQVIPEPVFTQADYQREIFQRMYRDIAPLDPEGILQHEWLNARGAIARWDRHSIEIRVLDIQECPLVDLAICQAIRHVLQRLLAEEAAYAQQQNVPQTELVGLLAATIRNADEALVTQPQLLAALGLIDVEQLPAREVWRRLLESMPTTFDSDMAARKAIDAILEQGVLARRMSQRLSAEPTAEEISELCHTMCDCLAEGRMLHGIA